MKYVYKILNSEDTVLYIGQTEDPKRRFNQHTKSKPFNGSGSGMFYNRTDVRMKIIEGPINEKEARDLEEELQIQFGFKTDRQKSRNGLLKGCKKGGCIAGRMKRIITYETAELIRKDYNTGNYSYTTLGNKWDLSKGMIANIIQRRRYVEP